MDTSGKDAHLACRGAKVVPISEKLFYSTLAKLQRVSLVAIRCKIVSQGSGKAQNNTIFQ
jgi:hypothetical protein